MLYRKTIASVLGIGLLFGGNAYAEEAPKGQGGKVEWVRTAKMVAPANTIDFTYSLDGKFAFFLTSEGKVEVYNKEGGKEGSVSVDAGVSRIDIAPQGELLYLLNDKENSLSTYKIDFVVDIDTTGSPVLGKVDAPVSIVVFTDFECPYCKKLVPLLHDLYTANKEQANVVFKNMPLDMHPHAKHAARAALAANAQGKFWEYHDELFAQNRINKSTMEDLADDLELDMVKYRADVDSKAIHDQVAKDIRDAQAAGVTGTPTVFINGHKVVQRNMQVMQAMIDAELKKAGLK